MISALSGGDGCPNLGWARIDRSNQVHYVLWMDGWMDGCMDVWSMDTVVNYGVE